MQKNVKRAGDERLTKVPADLDEKPYRDEHDYELLRRMEACIAGEGAKTLPPGVKAADVRHSIKHLEAHLKNGTKKAGRTRRAAR
jgi:hypothetical protein